MWTCPPPPPPIHHLVSIWRHSRDKCSQAFPVFRRSSTSIYYAELSTKTQTEEQKWGRPGNETTYTRYTICIIHFTCTCTLHLICSGVHAAWRWLVSCPDHSRRRGSGDIWLIPPIDRFLHCRKHNLRLQHQKLATSAWWHSTFLMHKLVISSQLWIFDKTWRISQMSPDPLLVGGVWARN